MAAWLVCLALVPVSLVGAQSSGPGPGGSVISGVVSDGAGMPVAHASLRVKDAAAGAAGVMTGNDGQFVLRLPAGMPVVLHVEATGFRTEDVSVGGSPGPGAAVKIVMMPAGPQETVTVSAYGAPLRLANTPASTLVLSHGALTQTAGQALDDKLRQVAGFELFRRTSSLVSNPTSQGVSLRGLGSTAASRTLVLSDEDPLNDPYGGWIHWDEVPELVVQSATIVRGGASDLYGSSAIGGVVDLSAVRPQGNSFQMLSSYGSLNTFDDAGLGTARRGKWTGLAAGGVLLTDGYTLVSPHVRGPVDVNSNVHAQNGRVELDRDFLATGHGFVRANVLNEARNNGTPLTPNGTRLWRMESGADWSDASGGSLLVRLHGTADHYRQAFSSIAVGRRSEALTRFVETPATELGGTVRWTQALKPDLLVLGGADTRDVRAVDEEVGFSTSGKTKGQATSLKDITARQRQTGLYGEVLWTPEKWTISAGGRVDFFRTFDAAEYYPAVLAEPRAAVSREVWAELPAARPA